VDGVDLPDGEISGRFPLRDVKALSAKTYGKKFDIDAIFATDIIPRGCEVRQSRQSR
jgi:hypothetical protein